MKTPFGVILTAMVFAGYILLLEQIPAGGLVAMIVVILAALLAVIVGSRLPLIVRLLITGLVFEFGYSMCLVGRTMEPGFTGHTLGMALFMFVLFASLPFLSLIRIWSRRTGLWLLVVALPVSLGIAVLVAAFEEWQFVQRHRTTGIGPTARWTVSNHWLSYDAAQQQLHGSD
jgi:glucan phosphoethanolaminetransferase (alkaline phosphatase superfamily)